MFYHIRGRPVVEPKINRTKHVLSTQKHNVVERKKSTYHGSNSCIILSNLMTAKRRDEKPATHAKSSTTKTIRLLMPALLFNFATGVDFFWPACTIFDEVRQKHDTHTQRSIGYCRHSTRCAAIGHRLTTWNGGKYKNTKNAHVKRIFLLLLRDLKHFFDN